MTSMLTDDDRRSTRMTKPMKAGKKKMTIDGTTGAARDETRTFLDFSRENLSISQSELEQGFNKPSSRCSRPSGHSILSLVAILVALACAGVEIWKLHRVISNTRDIEIIKRDVEALRHRFLGEDFMDELKAFEEQLYADGSDADEDSGEADIESADYDSNYEEDYSPSWTDYASDPSDPTTATPVVRSSRNSLTSASSSSPARQKLESKVKSLPKTRELKQGEGVASKQSLETDEDHPKRRRAVTEETQSEVASNVDRPVFANSFRSEDRNHTRYESLEDEDPPAGKKKKSNEAIPWERHPPKKYFAITRLEKPEDFPLPSQPMRRRHSFNHTRDLRRSYQVAELTRGSLKPRVITRRHLRAPRQVYAAHYGADSTLFGMDDEHTGNGRAKHNGGIFKAWRPSEWVTDLGMSRHFTLSRDGRLAVHEAGLYLVYGQIHYLDEHDENGFHILVNGQPILQCMVYSPGTGHKSRSCFSAQITVLQAGDRLILKDAGPARYTLFQHDKSFFGLVKLGDSRQQQHHAQSKHTTQAPDARR